MYVVADPSYQSYSVPVVSSDVSYSSPITYSAPAQVVSYDVSPQILYDNAPQISYNSAPQISYDSAPQISFSAPAQVFQSAPAQVSFDNVDSYGAPQAAVLG